MPAAAPAAEPAAVVAPPGFFGVDGLEMTSEDFDLLRDADAGVFRAVFPFSGAKTRQKQPYQWGGFDYVFYQTAARGIDLLPVLYGSPPWIAKDRSVVPLHNHQAIGEWRLFLEAVVARYGPGGAFWNENPYLPYEPVDTWQIWNEPNSITWWAPRPKPKEYALLLQRSADAVHSVDPAARIMTAGIVARPTNAHAIPGKKFMSKLFAYANAREATDVVAFHPYSPSVPGVRHQIVSARRVLRKAGVGGLPIWITEIGWGTKGPKNHPLIKSKDGQARALRDTFEMVLREREDLGIERLLWYHWRDSKDKLCLWCESSGLLDRHRRKKEIFRDFRQIAVP